MQNYVWTDKSLWKFCIINLCFIFFSSVTLYKLPCHFWSSVGGWFALMNGKSDRVVNNVGWESRGLYIKVKTIGDFFFSVLAMMDIVTWYLC